MVAVLRSSLWWDYHLCRAHRFLIQIWPRKCWLIPKKHHVARSFEELGRYLFEASAVCQIISAAFTLQVAFNLVFTIGGSINISGAVLCGILVDSCGASWGHPHCLVLIMDPQTRARNLVYKPIPEEFQVCRHSIIAMNGVKLCKMCEHFILYCHYT